MIVRPLAIAALLAVSIPSCPPDKPDGSPGSYVIKVPPTKECPSGLLEVTPTGPTTAEVRCNPTPEPTPSASPSSSPAPSPGPSPSPEPSASPSPAASPTPSPGPTPTPSPRPSPTPTTDPSIGPDGNYPAPAPGTLPALWDKAPDRVTVGDMPHNGNGQGQRVNDFRWRVVLNTTPRSNKPLQWKNTDEQWPPAAHEQAKRGEGPLMWWAEYPGTSCSMSSWDRIGPGHECAVEHPSRLCDAQEQAEDAAKGLNPENCRRPHAFMAQDIVIRPGGTNGGPEGPRKLCAAPPGKPAAASCRRWLFRYGRVELLP